MEKSDIEAYIKRLQELDRAISDDSDSTELMTELNKILNGLSTDMELDVGKKLYQPH